MKEVHFYMKSGNSFSIVVSSFEVTRDQRGNIIDISSSGDNSRIIDLDINEVEAIVEYYINDL